MTARRRIIVATVTLAVTAGLIIVVGGPLAGLLAYRTSGSSTSAPVTSASPAADSTPRSTRRSTPTATWWVPAPRSSWQVQYSGTIDMTQDVSIYDLDGADTSAATVARLRARDVRTICYINAGAWEDWRADASAFPSSVIGTAMSGWAGERWLDIRRVDVLLPIMTARMEVCQDKGFDAVDADNVMGYRERTGFQLTGADQLEYNRALASTAHGLGLGFGLKNDPDQVRALLPDVDFAVNEECVAEGSCSAYAPLLAAGKAVFNIEYDGSLASICAARPAGFSTLLKTLELTASRQACSL